MRFHYHADSGNETRIIEIGLKRCQFTRLKQADLYSKPTVVFVHRLKYADMRSPFEHRISIVDDADVNSTEVIDFIQKRARGSFYLKHRPPRTGIYAMVVDETTHYYNISFRLKEDALMCMMRFKDARYEE